MSMEKYLIVHCAPTLASLKIRQPVQPEVFLKAGTGGAAGELEPPVGGKGHFSFGAPTD